MGETDQNGGRWMVVMGRLEWGEMDGSDGGTGTVGDGW